ncbi:MAG: TadE/TadG family type IV pilus assembly protein, partial [Nocardioides sp.]
VMPLLLTILFGLITTGLAFSDHLSATNATREGARYGAATPFSDPDAWATSVRDRVKQVYFNAGETVTDDQICVSLVKSDASTVASYAGANCGTTPTPLPTMTAGSCAVVVWMQRPRSIRLLVIPDLDLDIRAESVAFYGREVSPTCTAS